MDDAGTKPEEVCVCCKTMQYMKCTHLEAANVVSLLRVREGSMSLSLNCL